MHECEFKTVNNDLVLMCIAQLDAFWCKETYDIISAFRHLQGSKLVLNIWVISNP